MGAEFRWLKSPQQIETDKGINRAFELFVAENAARRMDKYVPMLTGMLAENFETGVDSISGYVRYNQPYAHYQYTGVNFDFTKDFHPLATSYWDKAMMNAEKQQFVKEINLARVRFAK